MFNVRLVNTRRSGLGSGMGIGLVRIGNSLRESAVPNIEARNNPVIAAHVCLDASIEM